MLKLLNKAASEVLSKDPHANYTQIVVAVLDSALANGMAPPLIKKKLRGKIRKLDDLVIALPGSEIEIREWTKESKGAISEEDI